MSVRRCLSCSLILGLVLSLPAYAQDAAETPPADAPAADAAAAADAGAGDAAAAAPADSAADTAAPADSGSEASGADQTVTAEGNGDAGSGRKPFPLYVGADYAFLTASLSKDQLKTALGGSDSYDSNFYRLRVGTRLLEAIGIEAQYGIKGGGSNDVDTNQMYGLYLVPTGVMFDLIEVSAPIGYTHLELKNGNGKVKFDGASFGLNIEVPVYVNDGGHIPAIRIGGGGTVYYAEREARVYGFQAGLRLDFKL